MNPSCSTSWHNPALGQPSGACREAELTRHSDIRGLLVGVGGAMWAGRRQDTETPGHFATQDPGTEQSGISSMPHHRWLELPPSHPAWQPTGLYEICIPVLLIFYCVASAMLWQWLGPMVSNAGGYSGRPESKEVLPWTDQSRDPSVANPELSMAPRNCKVPWRILTFCCYCSSKTCVKSSLSRTSELGLDVSKTLARASAGLWPVWVLLLFSVADPSHSASDLSYLRHVGNSGYLALLV
ncbi:hypothetical protein CPAR01_04110 [Colletotrichum paranaense]|uniref:Uncharacterized protein n=1 Tax=Colletotrichum paranaense TaxID=1914294 RepID=A0ABQ9SVE3_9PEZI|nr:uncharacterized protein CPAR01_04110 [Colletotrichum paranaense]KAK1543477.1 hypothetical protein CPAR01_04110 [Colletotrichum paranaense]